MMFIILIIFVIITVSGLLFYNAYDRATSRPSYETLEVRVDCEDYRLASVEEWKMMNFEVNDNIATKREFNYDITTQKVCMDFESHSICTEACENQGFSNVGWEPDNNLGQHVCMCQR